MTEFTIRFEDDEDYELDEVEAESFEEAATWALEFTWEEAGNNERLDEPFTMVVTDEHGETKRFTCEHRSNVTHHVDLAA